MGDLQFGDRASEPVTSSDQGRPQAVASRWHAAWPGKLLIRRAPPVYLPKPLEAAPGFEPGYGALQAPA
jgi:hypothetical protein